MEKPTVSIDNVERFAQIEIYDGKLRIFSDWNTDYDPPDGHITDDWKYIQRYDYSSAWSWDKSDIRLQSNFFWMVTERSGEVCGGIEIDDYDTIKELQTLVDKYEVISPWQIPTVDDGVYMLCI